MSHSQPEPLLVTVEGAARMLGVSRSKMFKLLREDKVTSVLLGPQIRRVPVAALHAYIAELMPANGRPLAGDSDAA